MKKKLIANGLLCVILDHESCAALKRDIFSLARAFVKSGVDIVQYRFKSVSDREALSVAGKLERIVHREKKILLVNDRVDIAGLSDADGVHLGEGDIPVNEARTILGKSRIIGKTVHSKQEFMRSQREPVDYVSLGPVYSPGIKPQVPAWGLESIAALTVRSRVPVFVIGGITPANVASIARRKITRIAVGKALLAAHNIPETVKNFKEQICLKKFS